MATTYSNLATPAQSRPIASTPRYRVTRQHSTGDTEAPQDARATVLGGATPAVLQPRPGYATRAARWLAEAVVLGFAAYGAAHVGVPLDRLHDLEPPL